MSFFGLNIAGSALDAYQEAANVTSDNIANVNTPGASRQSVDLREAAPVASAVGYVGSMKGSGVVADGITRIHADSYDGLFRNATADQGFYGVQEQQLTSLQSAFGEPSNGINSAFSSLQTAIGALASDPANTSLRQGVLSAANGFAAALNRSGGALANAQAAATQQASSVVAQANGLIDKIAALNGQIRAAKAVGDSAATYADERDADIDALSQLVPTQTSVQANGSALVTVGGRALVNDTVAYHLAAPAFTPSASGKPSLSVGIEGDPPGAAPLTATGGQLGGLLDVVNAKIAPYGAALDGFASAAATEINRVTAAGYDANGNAGGPLFTGTTPGAPITASTIAVALADPSQLAVALPSTAAGTLAAAMNGANLTVDPSAALAGSTALAHPAAAAASGSLTVTVDGVAQTYAYDTSAGGNAATIDGFVTSFNAAGLGVSASYDPAAQKIVFARDPGNEGPALRAAAPTVAVRPDFTISDSNAPTGGSDGTPSSSLLEVLGAAAIDNVPQTAANALGSADGSGAIALGAVFSRPVGVAAGAPPQTLGAYYGALIGRMGTDVQTAQTGSDTQTQLASGIDKVRQGIDGINLDEETQNLIKYQNAYQAAARTLNVLDQLLQTAIGLLPGA